MPQIEQVDSKMVSASIRKTAEEMDWAKVKVKYRIKIQNYFFSKNVIKTKKKYVVFFIILYSSICLTIFLNNISNIFTVIKILL